MESEKEQDDLTNKRTKLKGITNFWKVVSDAYYVAALDVRVNEQVG